MWQLLIQLSVVGAVTSDMAPGGTGAVWPRPRYQSSSPKYWTLSRDLKLEVVTSRSFSCGIIARAIRRTDRGLSRLRKLSNSSDFITSSMPALSVLRVRLRKPCEITPSLYMNEQCMVTIYLQSYITYSEFATDDLQVPGSDTGARGIARLTARSVWGILRGLETFGQLFYFSKNWKEVRINATLIRDKPRYLHRGLLLDSARHFLPPRAIRRTLAAMAHSKLNVLHWHLTDDESFPLLTRRVPQLAILGAYHPSAIYRPSDIRSIVQFATDRGIRIVPELDVPGHTRSWAAAFPQVMSQCGRNSSLDPTKNDTYKLINALLQDIHDLFPDQFIHLGGDETDFECWAKDRNVRDLASFLEPDTQVLSYFMDRAIQQLPPDRAPVVWEDVYNAQEATVILLPRNTIVQMWKNASFIETVVKDGLRVVHSSSWYLDVPESWQGFYNVEPRSGIEPKWASKVLGGEACMWGEGIDEANLDSRVWPRASVVAEVLWSGCTSSLNSAGKQSARVAEHTCRLRRLGVHATPSAGPGFCLL